VAKGLQGLHRRHRYPATVSCYTTSGDTRNGFLCTTAAWKEDLLKAGVTGGHAIFLAGKPIDGRARALVTRLGTLPAGAYLRNNVSGS